MKTYRTIPQLFSLLIIFTLVMIGCSTTLVKDNVVQADSQVTH